MGLENWPSGLGNGPSGFGNRLFLAASITIICVFVFYSYYLRLRLRLFSNRYCNYRLLIRPFDTSFGAAGPVVYGVAAVTRLRRLQ